MKHFLVIIGLLAFGAVRAEEEVIDLGGLEVNGEVRQPPVRLYQSPEVPEAVLKDVAEEHFEKFERELLSTVGKLSEHSDTQPTEERHATGF